MQAQKKDRPEGQSSFVERYPALCERSYAYIRFARSLLGEDYSTVYQCEKGMVLADTYILTRIVKSAALTDDDVACLSELTTEKFYAESFTFRLTAVLRTTYTFFVCHFL